MLNSEIQQIVQDGTALLAESPFHFKPSGTSSVIPLLAICGISESTREKPHALQMLIPGRSHQVVEVRLVGDTLGNGYALSPSDARKLIEKLAQLPYVLKAR